MNPEKLTVTALFQARPDKEAELRAALINLIGPTLQEKGCLNYDLHEPEEEGGKFFFYENWEDKKDLNAHLDSAHVKELLKQVDELCAIPPKISFWKQLK